MSVINYYVWDSVYERRSKICLPTLFNIYHSPLNYIYTFIFYKLLHQTKYTDTL